MAGEPVTAINAVAPPGGCNVFVICMATIASATAKAEANQSVSGKSLAVVTTHQSGNDMSAHQVSGLCQRTLDYAIDQDTRGTERAYQKNIIFFWKGIVLEVGNAAHTDKST